MLHPTRLPDCTDLLERILDFQERLLELGCSHSQLSPEDFRQALGEEIFAWLVSTKATKKLYEPIYWFARLPQAEKDAIRADFLHDRQYIDHLDDPDFQFRLLGDTGDQNSERIRSWLVNFYEQFAKTSGIAGAITRGDAISKDAWWQTYSQGNGGRLTCAVCDGTMNHAITVEHYLPKGRYPVLALHPHNLIPACDKCNNPKEEKDPLKGRTFDSIFVPYREAVRDVAHLEFEESQGEIQVRIAPNDIDSQVAEKIDSLADLFDLPGQWQRNIREIGKIALRRVDDYFAGLRDEGIVPKPQEFPIRLNRICARMEQDWGVQHYGYPATEWLRWMSQDAQRREHLLREVSSLGWADTRER